MKKVLFSAALLMGLSAVSFAGNPKGEASPATSETKTKVADAPLYWFSTEDDGSLTDPSGIDPLVQPSETAPCDGSSPDMCARGFTQEQTHIVDGKRVPLNPNGGEEVYKD